MKKKILLINLIMLIIVFLLSVPANAVNATFKVQINASTKAANYGDEVSFSISLADLVKGDDEGTNAITGTIK